MNFKYIFIILFSFYTSIANANEAVRIIKELQSTSDSLKIQRLKYCISNSFVQERYSESLELAKYLYEITKNNHIEEHFQSCNFLISLYTKFSLDDKAMEAAIVQLKISENIPQDAYKANAHLNIADIYKNIGNLDQATIHYNNANVIASKNNYLHLLTYIYENKADIKKMQQHFEQAIKYYDTARSFADNNIEINARILIKTATCFQKNNQKLIANTHLREALLFANKTNSPKLTAEIHKEIGIFYSQMNAYDSALLYFQKSIPQFSEEHNIKSLILSWTYLATIYAAKNDFANAYHFQHKADSANNIVYSNERKTKTEQLKAAYENERKDRLIAELNNEKGLIAWFALFIIFIVISIFLVLFSHRNKKLIEAKIKLEIQQKALMESEEKYRSLTEHLPVGVYRSLHNGQLLFCNEALAEIMGAKNMDEMLKKNIHSFYTDFTKREEVFASFNQRALSIMEYELRRLDGQIIIIRNIGRIVRGEQGEVLYYEGIIENITRQKEYENQLIQSKNKAEESDRLKNAFLSNLSHEIRTPLNAIIGFSQMICERQTEKENQELYLSIINESSSRLLSVIDDLLEISKIVSGQLKLDEKILNMENVIYDIIISASKKNTQNNIIFYSSPQDHLSNLMLIDLNKVSQIIQAVISNAIKFTSQGTIIVEFTKSNDKFRLKVWDNGIGITKNMIDQVFEPFRQIDNTLCRKYGGNGLGLTIAKGLLDFLGGTIEIISDDNQGCFVELLIPYRTANNNSDNNSKLENRIDSSTKKLVIVDNSALSKKLYQQIKQNINIPYEVYSPNELFEPNFNNAEVAYILRENEDVQLLNQFTEKYKSPSILLIAQKQLKSNLLSNENQCIFSNPIRVNDLIKIF